MERLKQVENKHMKILDHQGMKFVRYVVFDESPLLMIIIRKGERGLTTG